MTARRSGGPPGSGRGATRSRPWQRYP
jgi:hypothetical protein